MFFFSRKGRDSLTLSQVTEKLSGLRIPIAYVFTPINLEQEKKSFLESDTYNPQFKYRQVSNENEKILSSLSSVKLISNVDPRISDFYVKLIEEKHEASQLMHAVGDNERVSQISKDRFKMPSAKLFRNATRILRGKVDKYNLLSAKKIVESRWLGYDEVKEAVEIVLKEVGLGDWHVEMSKKITKNGVKTGLKRKEIIMDPNIKKRAINLRKTIVHEIGTHVLRSYNGFSTGYDALGGPNLPDYLDVEEGLATWNEEKMGVLGYTQFRKKALGTWAIYIGESLSFRELFNGLLGIVPRLEAFDIAYRIKRGMSDTSLPGVYCKDVSYLRGFRRVTAKLTSDSSLYDKLYAGKISFSQTKWVDDGLIPRAKLLPDWDAYGRAFKKAGI